MSNTLTINTSIIDDHWEITGTMSAGTLPAEIFIYSNTGSNTLGDFVGVCSLSELSRLQIFTGTTIPIFGNKFVRTNTISIVTPLSSDTTIIVSTIVSSVNLLSTAYKAKTNTTQVFTIV